MKIAINQPQVNLSSSTIPELTELLLFSARFFQVPTLSAECFVIVAQSKK